MKLVVKVVNVTVSRASNKIQYKLRLTVLIQCVVVYSSTILNVA